MGANKEFDRRRVTEGGDLISRLTTQRYEFGWTALHFIAGNNAVRILDWILG
ncbi:hypothetical protein AK812_SmicGene44526, partial [Symbiodinium microadriaticum]